MAGDGQRNHCGTITNRKARKVRCLNDGTLVGTSGDVGFGDAVVNWIEEGGVDNAAIAAPKLEMDGGFACLILRPSGELLLMGQDCRPCAIETPYAVGSGMDLAIGAMRAGATPKQAVEIACEYDEHSGGEIAVFTLACGRSIAA